MQTWYHVAHEGRRYMETWSPVAHEGRRYVEPFPQGASCDSTATWGTVAF